MNALEIRLTHRYVGSCQHMDSWESIGTFETLGRTTLGSRDEDDDDPDPCEPTTDAIIVRVRLEKRRGRAGIARALTDSLTRQGCHHEHDCCGCWSWFVSSAKEIADEGENGRLWVVIRHGSRNF